MHTPGNAHIFAVPEDYTNKRTCTACPLPEREGMRAAGTVDVQPD